MQDPTLMPPVHRAAAEAIDWSAISVFLLLLALSFGPSATRYHWYFSSFAVGIVAVAMLAIGLRALGLTRPSPSPFDRHFVRSLSIAAFIMGHVFFTYLVGEPELERSLTSLLAATILLISAPLIGFTLFGAGGRQELSLQIMLPIFAAIAVFGLLGIAPYSELASDRPMYPFTEPSHFALAVMPFLIYAAVTANQLIRLSIIALAAIAVVLLKSLSLAVGVVLAGACCLQGFYFAAFSVAAIASLGSVDLLYFTDRLDFAYGNQNLSMLVYRQGLELIEKSLVDTSGLGVGFQRLGFTDLFTPSSNIIYSLTKADLNLQDGGFLAAKLVAEFGIAGVLLVGGYTAALLRGIFVLRKVANRKINLPAGTIFAFACIVGFSVEMFVRGAGYFTPTALLAVAAIPYVLSSVMKEDQIETD